MKPSPPRAFAPALETQRFRLRAFRSDDFYSFCAYWNDPAVYRFIAGQPLSQEEHWARLSRLVGQWPLCGFGSWAVEEKASGQLIGQCGFGLSHREMSVPMPEPESGWAFMGSMQGKGIGTEATLAATKWGDENIELPKTACIIAPENLASIRLAHKLGFKQIATATYKSKQVLLLHRDRSI